MKETLLCLLEISVWDVFWKEAQMVPLAIDTDTSKREGGARGRSQRTVALFASLGFREPHGVVREGTDAWRKTVQGTSSGWKSVSPRRVQQCPD